jgi:hypothetical protein
LVRIQALAISPTSRHFDLTGDSMASSSFPNAPVSDGSAVATAAYEIDTSNRDSAARGDTSPNTGGSPSQIVAVPPANSATPATTSGSLGVSFPSTTPQPCPSGPGVPDGSTPGAPQLDSPNGDEAITNGNSDTGGASIPAPSATKKKKKKKGGEKKKKKKKILAKKKIEMGSVVPEKKKHHYCAFFDYVHLCPRCLI